MEPTEILKTIDLFKKQFPTAAIALEVSPQIWDHLVKQSFIPGWDLGYMKFMGIAIRCNKYYRDDWWSEHFSDRTVLHTSTGTTTIPN